MSEPSYEPKHVNVQDPSAAAYWARRFQVPVEEVIRAVRAIGNEPSAVAAHLGQAWPNEASGIV